jgi:hypothetical protein
LGGLGGLGGGGGLAAAANKKTVVTLRKRVEKEFVKAEEELAGFRRRGAQAQELAAIVNALKAVLDVPTATPPAVAPVAAAGAVAAPPLVDPAAESSTSQVATSAEAGGTESSSNTTTTSSISPEAYAASVKQVAAEQAEKLNKQEAEAKAAEGSCQATLSELSMEIEKWARRKLEAPNKEAVEAGREAEWAEQNKAQNEAALRAMRSFMPVDLANLTVSEFEEKVANSKPMHKRQPQKSGGGGSGGGAGGFYPPALMERLKSKKLLHWIITHPDDIARANFLMGAHKVGRPQEEYA